MGNFFVRRHYSMKAPRGEAKRCARCVKVRDYGKPKRKQSHPSGASGQGCRDEIHPGRGGRYEVFGRDEPEMEGPADGGMERGDGLGERRAVAVGEPGELPDEG